MCCYCTNRVHCTHINLKIVCSVCWCLCTPRTFSPVLIQTAIVWIIITVVVCACRHSGIWYFVFVLNTNRCTYWTTNKQTNSSNKKNQTKEILNFRLLKHRPIQPETGLNLMRADLSLLYLRHISHYIWTAVGQLWSVGRGPLVSPTSPVNKPKTQGDDLRPFDIDLAMLCNFKLKRVHFSIVVSVI